MNAFPVLAHTSLANAITSLSITFGLSGCLLAAEGAILPALICGALAIPCDVLDGMVARRFQQTSPFGAKYGAHARLMWALVSASIGASCARLW
jgi:phosphatidylserine synthase